MNLIEKYLGEGTDKIILKFDIKIANKLDEIDAMLVRGGITGTPDFNSLSITIDKKDLKKAEKILKKTMYKYTTG